LRDIPGWDRVEFHRHGLALLPLAGDRRPGVAFLIDEQQKSVSQSFCTCTVKRGKTCGHRSELAALVREMRSVLGPEPLSSLFKGSIGHQLATVLVGGFQKPSSAVRFMAYGTDGNDELRAFDPAGEELLRCFFPAEERRRLIERCSPPSGPEPVVHRGWVLEKLAALTTTEMERLMAERGMRTQGQLLEQSLWFRVAYHIFHEHGPNCVSWQPAIEEESGRFTLALRQAEQEARSLLRLTVARPVVPTLLRTLRELLPNQHGLAVQPLPLRSIFKATINTELDLEVRPVIQLMQANGEKKYLAGGEIERFRYGNLVYVKELGLMAELERADRERIFRAPVRMVLKKSQIPAFLEEKKAEIANGVYELDDFLATNRILGQPSRLEIIPEALDRDWCWLAATYGFGETTVSLQQILAAKMEGRRFIGVGNEWIDCESPDFDGLDILLREPVRQQLGRPETRSLQLSRLDLVRLHAAIRTEVRFNGTSANGAVFTDLLTVRPATALPPLAGLASALRGYQALGAAWLLHLFDHGFGGLLCDDMGLGKTHQVMGLMIALKEHRQVEGLLLIVCPTTVLSHWEKKLRLHAPALRACIYHGGRRDLAEARGADVLLTSYGILRQDIEALEGASFALAVFDEAHHLKNPQTRAYDAARRLSARSKLAVTGTPIENRLTDLKSLFDLVLPGYFGDEPEFLARYVSPAATEADDLRKARRAELARLVAPFTLRRTKKTVLHELPEKIEDLRTCRLSDDQIRLYREAIAGRAADMRQLLAEEEAPVPYMHIFALLNLLKQICNHPAQLEDEPADYEKFASGKWELFKEILDESLASGQKVVIYSQYVRMIRIIASYLEGIGIDHAVLTGQSRDRGAIVERFNTDQACRVFVGSLQAGGVGIDLVAASVVIHYDRWWNAAKEDQATDRVHRIGQNRGVQVFKLVTEGTLEEKIAALIDRKKGLLEEVVQEDDPGLLKSFTREQLLDLLAPPESPVS